MCFSFYQDAFEYKFQHKRMLMLLVSLSSVNFSDASEYKFEHKRMMTLLVSLPRLKFSSEKPFINTQMT